MKKLGLFLPSGLKTWITIPKILLESSSGAPTIVIPLNPPLPPLRKDWEPPNCPKSRRIRGTCAQVGGSRWEQQHQSLSSLGKGENPEAFGGCFNPPQFFWKIGEKKGIWGPPLERHILQDTQQHFHFLWNSFRFWGVSPISAWFWGAASVPPMPGGLHPGGGEVGQGAPQFPGTPCSKGKENPWIWGKGEAGAATHPQKL